MFERDRVYIIGDMLIYTFHLTSDPVVIYWNATTTITRDIAARLIRQNRAITTRKRPYWYGKEA